MCMFEVELDLVADREGRGGCRRDAAWGALDPGSCESIY